ncbi:MAG TPA: hypothetical protein VIT45_17030 [Allosphingosinicella sp.]
MEKTRMILIGAGGVATLGLAAAAALALAPDRPHGPMAMFDADRNQVLTLAEVRQGARTMFAQVDSNKDGRATEEELRAHHEAMGKGRGGHGERGKYGHKGGDGPGRGGPHRGGPMEMDSDSDGALTLAEVEAGLNAHFTKADANRDGSVTEAEMDAAHRAKHDAR